MSGVIRREILKQTHLLPNFADRAILAELALFGRFRSSLERLFLKRFHANVSWALNQRELKSFLSTDGKPYWRRARQLQAYFLAPTGKSTGAREKVICTMMVAKHCIETAAQALTGKEARNAALGLVRRGARSRFRKIPRTE
jgi:hypothetical protein